MSDDAEADAILTRFRAALGEIYGDRLDRVVLYGARAGRSPARFGLRYRRLHQGPGHTPRGFSLRLKSRLLMKTRELDQN
jgi:hypothetical protein